jgi:hypothetical protein
VQRRQYLGGFASVASGTVVAGCTGVGGPDPTVEDTNIDGSLATAFTGEAEVEVRVRNDGDTGDITVTVEILDSNGTVIGDFSQTVTIEADETRRVSIAVEVDEDAERYTAKATPA